MSTPSTTSPADPNQNRLWLGLLLTFIITVVLSRSGLYSPREGIGYWMGIVGALQMLSLLLYPLRKYWKVMAHAGNVRLWFKVHMMFGISGPLLIVAHSTMHFGSTNAIVAFTSMSIVALSGLIGRFLYVHIHKGVYGEKESIEEMRKQIQQQDAKISVLPAAVTEILHNFEQRALSPLPMLPAIHRFMFLRLERRRALQQVLTLLPVASARQHFPAIQRYIASVARAAQFQHYERLFSLWHVAHVPFVFLLGLTAIAHVIAVNMY